MAGLAPTYGRGAMTNSWTDIRNANLILSMGGNSAEAHPVGFRWVIEAKEKNNAKLISIDPRFTRTGAVADYHASIRTGTDIVWLGGLINYLLTTDKINHEYVKAYTDVAIIVKEDFDFHDGLFSGYKQDDIRAYDKSSWSYEFDEKGMVKEDPTLQHPRCVYQLMRKHYSRYTIEKVESVCGMPRDQVQKVWDMIAETAAENKTMTILYALGWTQHSVGAQMIRAGSMVQLLLGNIGMLGGGVNALRGHSNIQGLTDLGLLSNQLPGYIRLPSHEEQDFDGYIERRAKQPLRPGQVSYWKYFKRFHVSLMKSWYGDAATAENNWCYDWLPKLTEPLYDVMHTLERMHNGEITGYLAQGFNFLASFPNKNKNVEALSKLKFLVVMDPLDIETTEFWKNHGEYNDVDSSKIQTEVFRLPTTCFAEENGSIVNSCRWLQWHWRAAPPPGESRPDVAIMAGIFHRLQQMYRDEGGAFPDPILNLTWPYSNPEEPNPEDIAQEYNGRALADLPSADGKTITHKKGDLLDDFGYLTDDGRTACGCWIYSGCWTRAGNMMDRRDNADPYNVGITLGWAWSWPLNRRILYNRASARPDGTSWAPEKRLIWWNGERWAGPDIPDFPWTSPPEAGASPFILNQEGVAHFFGGSMMAEGPFPEHYEPFESPLDYNPMHPDNPAAKNNPAARIFVKDREQLGTSKDFPYAATTYRITEHFHFWTTHARLNAIAQPEKFVEIGEDLANELGIKAGDTVKVTSKRGFIRAIAVVTKRIHKLQVEGRTVHQIGIPIHWGFKGVARKGFLTNTLTPVVGDANTQTPEFKSFLVNVEKV